MSVDQLKSSATDNLARIRAAVDALERNTPPTQRGSRSSPRKACLSCPFSNKQSQVTQWSPSYEISETRLAALERLASDLTNVRLAFGDLISAGDSARADWAVHSSGVDAIHPNTAATAVLRPISGGQIRLQLTGACHLSSDVVTRDRPPPAPRLPERDPSSDLETDTSIV